jgi:hypothetical protein
MHNIKHKDIIPFYLKMDLVGKQIFVFMEFCVSKLQKKGEKKLKIDFDINGEIVVFFFSNRLRFQFAVNPKLETLNIMKEVNKIISEMSLCKQGMESDIRVFDNFYEILTNLTGTKEFSIINQMNEFSYDEKKIVYSKLESNLSMLINIQNNFVL